MGSSADATGSSVGVKVPAWLSCMHADVGLAGNSSQCPQSHVCIQLFLSADMRRPNPPIVALYTGSGLPAPILPWSLIQG
eukprot:1397241-Pyramimonas_sp.AAC.1